MLIERILREPGGCVVTIDKKEYHFKPKGKDARHICEVTEQKHIARFLSITEGYQLPDDSPELIPADDEGGINLALSVVKDIEDEDESADTGDSPESADVTADAPTGETKEPEHEAEPEHEIVPEPEPGEPDSPEAKQQDESVEDEPEAAPAKAAPKAAVKKSTPRRRAPRKKAGS